MRSGRLSDHSTIVICFWALYSPLSMIFWYESGGNYAKLAVVLLIGVLIVFAYLSLITLLNYFGRPVRRVAKTTRLTLPSKFVEFESFKKWNNRMEVENETVTDIGTVSI